MSGEHSSRPRWETGTCRTGRIRMTVVLAILLTVGVTAGWSALLGWPALILAADLAVTAGWLLRHRAGVTRRTAVVTGGAGA